MKNHCNTCGCQIKENQKSCGKCLIKRVSMYFILFVLILVTIKTVNAINNGKIILNSTKQSQKSNTNAVNNTYCENVNSTGYVINSQQIAVKMTQHMRNKGVDYIVSEREVANTVKGYCQSYPYASSDDSTAHLLRTMDAAIALSNQ